MGRIAAIIVSGMLAGCMLCFPGQAMEAAVYGCKLWAEAIMPGLFPFLTCMLAITGNLRHTERAGISPLFGLPTAACPVVFMGWLTGSPGGARLAQELYDRDLADTAAVRRLAIYTGTMSPMFMMGTIALWLKSPLSGILIAVSHWLGAGITGQLSRVLLRDGAKAPLHRGGAAPSASMNLGQVIQSAAMAMLTVCGCMMLGCVAARMVSCAMPGLPQGVMALFQTLLEVTAGISRILALPLPEGMLALRPALICAATAFGGFSLMMQNLAFLQRAGVSFVHLLLGRLFHAAVSFGICLLLGSLLLPSGDAPVFAAANPALPEMSAVSPYFLLAWFCCLLFPFVFLRRK